MSRGNLKFYHKFRFRLNRFRSKVCRLCWHSVKDFPFSRAVYEFHPIQIWSFCSCNFTTFVKLFFNNFFQHNFSWVFFDLSFFHSLFCRAMCFLLRNYCEAPLYVCKIIALTLIFISRSHFLISIYLLCLEELQFNRKKWRKMFFHTYVLPLVLKKSIVVS